MRIMRCLLSGLLCVLVWAGCKTPAAQAGWKGPVEKTNINRNGQAINKIAFLEFALSLTDPVNKAYTCKLENYFLQEGTLRKRPFPTNASVAPHHIYAEILDNNGAVQATIVQDDPLSRLVEAPSDNDGKVMTSAVQRQQAGKLLVRFQYNAATRYIRIRLPGKNAQLLKPIYYAQL
jgi:hypothetical protein